MILTQRRSIVEKKNKRPFFGFCNLLESKAKTPPAMLIIRHICKIKYKLILFLFLFV